MRSLMATAIIPDPLAAFCLWVVVVHYVLVLMNVYYVSEGDAGLLQSDLT
jgi:hypothetical protein